jgi:ubiquitin C-terminal hydrolase
MESKKMDEQARTCDDGGGAGFDSGATCFFSANLRCIVATVDVLILNVQKT